MSQARTAANEEGSADLVEDLAVHIPTDPFSQNKVADLKPQNITEAVIPAATPFDVDVEPESTTTTDSARAASTKMDVVGAPIDSKAVSVQSTAASSGPYLQKNKTMLQNRESVVPKTTTTTSKNGIAARKIWSLDDIDLLRAPPPDIWQIPSPSWWTQKLPHRKRAMQPKTLPPANVPFFEQVKAYIQRWGTWIATVEDDKRREELMQRVITGMENVWQMGVDRGFQMEFVDTVSRNDQSTGAATMSGSQLAASIVDNGKGNQKSRKKRPTDPAKEPIITSETWKNSSQYAITRGEMEATGVTEAALQARLQSASFEQDGEELLRATVKELEEDMVFRDWHNVEPRTQTNPHGRELSTYCLYEVQQSRKSISTLENLLARFTGYPLRMKNTSRRIDEERERHNKFLALALELNESGKRHQPSEETHVDNSTLSGVDHEIVSHQEGRQLPAGNSKAGPSSNGENIVTSQQQGHSSVEADISRLQMAPARSESLLELVDQILQEDHVDGMNQVFEYSSLTHGDLTSEDGEGTGTAQLKHYLLSIIQNIRQIVTLRKQARNTAPSLRYHLSHQIEACRTRIKQAKTKLRQLIDNKSLSTQEAPGGLITARRDQVWNGGLPNDARASVDSQLGSLESRSETQTEEVQATSFATQKQHEGTVWEDSMPSKRAVNGDNEHDTVSSRFIIVVYEPSTDVDLQPVPKKQRLNGTSSTIEEETPTHSRATSSSMTPSSNLRRSRYINQVFRPRINELLTTLGEDEVGPEITKWHVFRQILEDVGIDKDQRNECCRLYNGWKSWEVEKVTPATSHQDKSEELSVLNSIEDQHAALRSSVQEQRLIDYAPVNMEVLDETEPRNDHDNDANFRSTRPVMSPS